MFLVYKSLVMKDVSIIEVNKSSSRIPTYSFKTSEYQSNFINEGNGVLHFLLEKPENSTKGLFYIRNEDAKLLRTTENVYYFGLNGNSKLLDSYYFVVRKSFINHILIIFSYLFLFIVSGFYYGLNKNEINWRFFMLSLVMFFLIMMI